MMYLASTAAAFLVGALFGVILICVVISGRNK